MKEFPYIKLEIYLPESHLPELQEVLRTVDAGHIGRYDACLSYHHVMGTWRPLEGTAPYSGAVGELNCEQEVKVEVTIRAFKVVKTFDLAQTDGKELPTIGPNELVGSIDGYPKLLQALQEISPVPVSFELIDGGAKGYYNLENKSIVIQDGMSEVQTIKTLLHEMAHQKLHDKDTVPEAKDITRNGKEVEAESVAYVVCQHYGINTSDYSFSYVAGWSEGKETPELKASLDKIRQTASEFIYQIDQRMEVLMAEKEQVQETAKTENPFVQGLADKITERAKELGFIPVTPEPQEKAANPELQGVVDKMLKDIDKKRTVSKVKEERA